ASRFPPTTSSSAPGVRHPFALMSPPSDFSPGTDRLIVLAPPLLSSEEAHCVEQASSLAPAQARTLVLRKNPHVSRIIDRQPGAPQLHPLPKRRREGEKPRAAGVLLRLGPVRATFPVRGPRARDGLSCRCCPRQASGHPD